MSLNYVLSILIATALITVGGYFFGPKIRCFQIIRKVITGILCLVAFYRYMIAEEAVFFIRGLNMTLKPGYEIPFGDNIGLTVFAVLLIWFSWAAMFTVVMNEFFKYEALKNIVKFFSIPILTLDIIFFNVYAIGIAGKYGFENKDIRIICLAIEIVLSLCLAITSMLRENLGLPNKKAVLNMLFALPFAILPIMPVYVPQALFGYLDAGIKIEDLTEAHRWVIYFGFIIPFIIFHYYKNKSYDVKRFAMIYLMLAMMWAFLRHYTFDIIDEPWSWPLHLCNTAMFIIPLCLIFKWDKVFYFCLFINVLGAFVAMLMPNTASEINAFAAYRFMYWCNHYAAFFMPILLIALGLFKRPKFKEWLYSQVSFAVYFLVVLICNAWFTELGHNPDFFFLNGDFIVEKLGPWAEEVRNISVSIPIGDLTLKFYPIYQTIFYLVYVVVSVGMWFLYALLFEIWDKAAERRMKERDYKQMKKDFNEYLGDRSIEQPLHGDGSPRIVLREFSKKYGQNKHYSVDHASFNVKGGEVFGFLGPNGAGKSTIIKSIVGIQTITSGNIEICGYDVEKQSVQAKLNLGFVPDHYALYENLTGREYINYVADLYNVSKKERDETIENMVTRFQLQGAFDNQMKTYSHGMKQKIAIMAALVHNPKVWILDEPLTGLDPTSIHEVKECMKEHAEKGNIVFFSSHIIDVVEKICDKIAIIKKGKIRAAASVAELEARGMDLEQFYLDTIYAEEDAPLVSINGDDILNIDLAYSNVEGE